MKKVIFVLLVAIVFAGCSKPEREVYAEYELISNTNCSYIYCGIGAGPCSSYIYPGLEDLSTPVPVGVTYTSETCLA